jgi:hypothetical protein
MSCFPHLSASFVAKILCDGHACASIQFQFPFTLPVTQQQKIEKRFISLFTGIIAHVISSHMKSDFFPLH